MGWGLGGSWKGQKVVKSGFWDSFTNSVFQAGLRERDGILADEEGFITAVLDRLTTYILSTHT